MSVGDVVNIKEEEEEEETMDGAGLVWTNKHAKEAVWVADETDGWVAGVLVEIRDGQSCMARIEEGPNAGKQVQIDLDKDGKTKKVALLPREVGFKADGLDNMDDLTHLHEGSILNNVCVRFTNKKIYTRTGPILVAMNPFEWLPEVYGKDVASAVRASTKSNMDNLPPHCFVEAEKAYRRLVSENQSQSLIICGESGAGKTETTKLMLQYLSHYTSEQDRCIAERIMDSNPVMEAFGNAKTLRNKNSSRFGKFIQLEFMDKLVHGAHVSNYLLEKSRTVRQNKGERNYHIFYQLCKGADPKQKQEMSIPNDLAKFHYINQSECFDVAGMDDAVAFKETMKAMESIGIAESEMGSVFKMIAAILHLGNVQCKASAMTEESKDDMEDNQEALAHACALLQCDKKRLSHALKVKYITVAGKSIEKPLQDRDIVDLRDAMAKSIYEKLFTYIVGRINKSLENGQPDSSKYSSFVGILDIYGFESFQTNGFEQLLINFANEKLQSLFNEQVFQAEEETYNAEGVPFSRTDIPDNSDCLLLATKIFKLMHDECLRMGAGSDKGLAVHITQQCKTMNHFTVCGPGTRVRNTTEMNFAIRHYAGEIIYDTNGFVDKNSDTLYGHIGSILADSQSELVRTLFPKEENSATGSNRLQETVARRFSGQVNALTETIRTTGPIFVRCIKSNGELVPGKVDRPSVLRQLRHSGVVAALEMRRAGFPNRLLYKDFVLRCRALLPRGAKLGDGLWRGITEKLFENAEMQSCKDCIALGKTKIFLRANILHKIDGIVTKQLTNHVIMVQSIVRQFLCARRHQQKRRAAVFAQKHFRGQRDRARLAAEIAALEKKRAWFTRTGQFERLRKRFEENVVCLFHQEFDVNQEGFAIEGVDKVRSYMKKSKGLTEALEVLLSQQLDLSSVDDQLGTFERIVSDAENTLQGSIQRKQELKQLQEALGEKVDQLLDLFENHKQDAVGQEGFLFPLRDIEQDKGVTLVDVIDRFASGYKSARIRLENALSEAISFLDQYNLDVTSEELVNAETFLQECTQGLENAIIAKQEIDRHISRLRKSTEATKRKFFDLQARLRHQTEVRGIEELESMFEKARQQVQTLLEEMGYPKTAIFQQQQRLAFHENHHDDDESSSEEEDEEETKEQTCAFIDIALVEQLIENSLLAIEQADELISRACSVVQQRQHAVKTSMKMFEECKMQLMDLGYEYGSPSPTCLADKTQKLILESSTVSKHLGKLTANLEHGYALLDSKVVNLGEDTSKATRELMETATHIKERLAKVRAGYEKVTGKLNAAATAQRKARALILPKLDQLRQIRSKLAQNGILERSDVVKAIESVELEIKEAQTMLVCERAPSSGFIEAIPEKIATTIQVIDALEDFAREEIETMKANRHVIVEARGKLSEATRKLGAVQGIISTHSVFSTRTVKSLCKASSCGAIVCDLSTQLMEQINLTESNLSRASTKLARLHDCDSAMMQKQLVRDLSKCITGSTSHCAQAEDLLQRLIRARKEELDLLEKHHQQVEDLFTRFYRARDVSSTIGRMLFTTQLLEDAQLRLARYRQAVLTLREKKSLEEEEAEEGLDELLAPANDREEDSIAVLMFIKRDPVSVIEETSYQALETLQTLEFAIQQEIGFNVEQEKERRDRLEREAELKELQFKEERALQEHLFQVRKVAAEKLQPVRTLVASVNEICQFLKDRGEKELEHHVHGVATLEQLAYVHHCLVMVEQAQERGDPLLLQEQVKNTVAQGEKLEELLLTGRITKHSVRRKMEKVMETSDDLEVQYANHAPEAAQKVRNTLLTSANTILEFQNSVHLEEAKFRAIKAEIELFMLSPENVDVGNSWSLVEKLEESSASLGCTKAKLTDICQHPPSTFVAMQCLDRRLLLSDTAETIKQDIVEMEALLSLTKANVKKSQVSLERCRREIVKQKQQKGQIKQRVVRFICPK